MSLGAGLCPAGVAPFGYGAPTGSPAPGAGYVPAVDAVVARRFDPPTLDYVLDLDATGAPHAPMDPLEQEVVLRLSTRRGRLPFARPFGNAWFLLEKAPADLLGFARRCAADALALPVSEGRLTIAQVEVEQVRGQAVMSVTWIDQRTRRHHTTRSG